MGLINTGTTVEMKVYLTELGRIRLLEQGFNPTQFSISDEDVNYNASLYVEQQVADLTGDYNDNVYSLSKNVTIKNQIIRTK
jgi:hypothetical protein